MSSGLDATFEKSKTTGLLFVTESPLSGLYSPGPGEYSILSLGLPPIVNDFASSPNFFSEAK